MPIPPCNSFSGPEECLAAGMDAFISKPLRNDALNQTMQQVLGV
jgi:CheY-like chemotaxis protein